MKLAKTLLAAHAAALCAAYAQSGPAFEVASVRPTAPAAQGHGVGMRGGPGTGDPGRFTVTSMPLRWILSKAYQVKLHQIFGPDWLDTERFDVIAKVPEGATREQLTGMLQNLLVERFALKLHHETKELPGYELVVGRNGHKLKESQDKSGMQVRMTGALKFDANGMPLPPGPGIFTMFTMKSGGAPFNHIAGMGQPLSALADSMEERLRREVIDKTGLTGLFDFVLSFAPPDTTLLPLAGGGETAPTISDAVQSQLGLRLEQKKVAQKILVVDHAERVPAEN